MPDLDHSPADREARVTAAFSPKALRFLAKPRFGVVSVTNPDGSPLQAVVWYDIVDGAILLNSRLGRTWPSDLLRDPRASLLVADGYEYVEVRGRVEVDCDPVRGLDVISALARRYQEDPEKTARQIAVFATERRVTFSLRPDRIYERLPD
jgi:PPOX class probable F420-dependent enzyme